MRAGQFLTRFGRINPRTRTPGTSSISRSRSAASSAATATAGSAPSSAGSRRCPGTSSSSARSRDANGEGNARSFLGDNVRAVHDLGDFEYVGALKQFFPLSDDWSLEWGLSGAFGPNGQSLGSHTEVYGTDLYLKWRPITCRATRPSRLHTEWMLRHRREPGATLQDVDGFAQLLWRFAMRWAVAGALRYGSPAYDGDWHVTRDSLDPKWTDEPPARHRQHHVLPDRVLALAAAGLGRSADWRPEPIWAVFLALEVAIGAHGAHAF